MSSGVSLTRTEAEKQSLVYYGSFASVNENEILDPRAVRNWVSEAFPHQTTEPTQSKQRRLRAAIVDSSIRRTSRPYRVLPIVEAESIGWIDVAGYLLARSPKNVLDDLEGQWQSIDFVLDVKSDSVTASPYL